MGKMIRLTADDGNAFDCWIEEAQGTRSGGIVILQEIFGVTEQLKGVALRYASLGFDVAIPALFDRQKPGTVVSFSDGTPGRELMLSSDLEETMLDVKAAVDHLAESGAKVGVIGFCWGGGLAVRAAQTLSVAAAVSFYGTSLPAYLDRPLIAPVQGHFGTRDSHVPPAMLAEARQYLGDKFQVFEYEAGHAFANDARPDFHVPDAAAKAHERAIAFLRKHLQTGNA
jgi:carboxymethylenebutenolidase